DMLGMNTDFQTKCVKKYIYGSKLFSDAINTYVKETKANTFPTK
ncbi:3-methyl-2-oxobutanoate hydroxymethyltransferase, partial [Francisella tularensis]